MSATKADLAAANESLHLALAQAEAEAKRLAELNEQWRKSAEIHPEASALSKCIKALDAVAPEVVKAPSTYGSTDMKAVAMQRATVSRIVELLSSRYGLGGAS